MKFAFPLRDTLPGMEIGRAYRVKGDRLLLGKSKLSLSIFVPGELVIIEFHVTLRQRLMSWLTQLFPAEDINESH